MSQKETKFQSKSKKFGGKGGGKFGGGGKKFGDKKGGFGKKFEGDRPPRDADGKSGDRGFGGKKRSFGDRADRGERKFDSDKPRGNLKDKPRGAYSDRPRREEGERRPYGDKPRRDFGDRKPRDFDGERKPRREFEGDRPRRSFDDKPKRDFGDRPKRDFGDRPRRSFDDKPKRDFGDRPKRDFGDRPKRDFGDRPPRRDDDRKPRREVNNNKPMRNFDGPKRKKRFDDRAERPSFDRHEASEETLGKLKSDRPSFGAPSPTFLYGIHAVKAALLNDKREFKRLIVTESGFESIREAYEEAGSEGIKLPEPSYVEKADIDRLLPRDAVHQDVLLDCKPLEEFFLADILISAGENAKILVLDQVTDPHNIGAILRSASAFGAMAVVVQKLHAPEITGTLAKTASGAVEYVPIVRETNLSRALEQLKEAGFFCIGLDERGKTTVAKAAPKGKVALVLGAEGDGLRRLVAENCDTLAKLPTEGPIASLNVSNAAAVALYELVRAGE